MSGLDAVAVQRRSPRIGRACPILLLSLLLLLLLAAVARAGEIAPGLNSLADAERDERLRRADVSGRRELRTEEPPSRNWGQGPFDVRNEHVLSLTRLSLGPDSPATLAQGDLSVFVRLALAQTIDVHPLQRYTLDAETLDGTLTIRAGVLPRVEAFVEAPFVWRWEGVFDPAVDFVETETKNVRRARKLRPPSNYAVEGLTDDGERFNLKVGAGVAKLRMGLKWRVLDGDLWPALSVEGIVDTPTASGGFGTQGVDAGIRVSLAKRIGRVILYGGAMGMVSGDDLGPIDAYPLQGGGFAAIELEIEPWISAIYQGTYMTPEWRNLTGRPGPILLHGGGFKVTLGRWTVELALIENGGDQKRSQDASAHLGIGVTF